MGLFKKKTPEQIWTQMDAKGREKAAKRGVDVEGALFVAHDLSDDSAFCTLVVRPDRVEVHDHGKVATLTRSGAGVTEVALTKINSIGVKRSGVFATVEMEYSGGELAYRTDAVTAPMIRDEIAKLMRATA